MEFGFQCNKCSVGGSVARANAANVSIIRFIHNIYTGEKIVSSKIIAVTNVVITATTLTHS